MTSNTPITAENIHEELLKRAITGPLSEGDALLWMVLVHTHEIRLRQPVLTDAPGITVVVPTTQRGAATDIAALWPDRADRRARYEFWYREYQLQTPYEDASELPPEKAARMAELRELLRRDPLVEDVVPEA